MELVLINKVVADDFLSDENSESSNSSDSELLSIMNKRKRNKHIKNAGYVKSVVPCYSLDDFRTHFRLSRAAIENFILELNTNKIVCSGRPPISILDSVLLTVWFLSNQESFRGVSDRFGFSRGHAHNIILKTCKLIALKVNKYIAWPKNQEAIKNIENFNKLRGAGSFPNVFGCVDGTHIAIPGPLADNSYYNRKGYHSVLLQAICNSRQEFIDIYCGWPGSTHDARMWQNSPIYNKLLTNRNDLLPNNCYLLGDTAYPLNTFIMVPFKDNGYLTVKQRVFNQKLSSSRVVIEQSFGRLLGMFRKLKYVYVLNLSYVKYLIFTACILHNVILREQENVEEYLDDGNVDPDIEDIALITSTPNLEAVEFRNSIMNAIC